MEVTKLSNVDILKDILRPNLSLVICGTSVGKCSAEVGSYYAGASNLFWKILRETKLTKDENPIASDNCEDLLSYGIGLTDIAKKISGVDAGISEKDYDIEDFISKMNLFKPKIVCFNGKRAAAIFLSWKLNRKVKTSDFDYGPYQIKDCKFRIFIAPSTSGSAKRYWEPAYWHELAELIVPSNTLLLK